MASEVPAAIPHDGASGAAGSGAAFVMPPTNPALKAEEDAAMQGNDLRVKLHMPGGGVESLKVKTSTEVGYVKLMLAERINMNVRDTWKLSLLVDGKKMMDPMSLCDYPNVNPPEVDFEVQINS